jgi:Flp pilus assembly pilin Flp
MKPARTTESGAALVELALILGVMVFIIYAGIALSYRVRAQLHAISMAGVASQLLYRDCRFESPGLLRIGCMDTLKANLEGAAQRTGFQTGIILSLYEDTAMMDGTSRTPPYTTVKIHDTGSVTIGEGSFNTQFTGSFTGQLGVHSELNGMVWIAEVYVSNPLVFLGIGAGAVYESSIS